MIEEHINQPQLYGLIGLGTIYWAAAALKIRNAGHIFYANDLRRLTTYAGSIPIAYGLLRFSEELLGIRSNQRVTSTAIMSMTGLLLDGVAFMWFPTLYENPSLKIKDPHSAVAFSRMGAAWLLWGVGGCLAVALFSRH